VPRIVVDPGVLISGLISRRAAPSRLLDLWAEGAVQLVVSPKLLEELERVVMRRKFRRYFTEGEARIFIESVRTLALVGEDAEIEEALTPDPEDDYLVALAREADADCIVSGDKHLTGLRDPRPPVLTPRELLDRLD
jgi:putative PIN family toxin of toxin-antitoxin system